MKSVLVVENKKDVNPEFLTSRVVTSCDPVTQPLDSGLFFLWVPSLNALSVLLGNQPILSDERGSI